MRTTLELSLQNLSPAPVPVSTTFLGVPDALLSPNVSNRNLFAAVFSGTTGAQCGTFEWVRHWGRGWSLCAVHLRHVEGFESLNPTVDFAAPDELGGPEGDGQMLVAATEGSRIQFSRVFLRVTINGDVHSASLDRLARNMPGSRTADLVTFYGRVPGTQITMIVNFYETLNATLRVEGMIRTGTPDMPDPVVRVEKIELLAPGAVLVLDYAEQRQFRVEAPELGTHVTRLTEADRFMVGQGLAFTGRLIVLERLVDPQQIASARALSIAPIVGQVASRALEGKWGLFGTLPKVHPAHEGREFALARQDYMQFVERCSAYHGSHWDFDGVYTGVHDPSQTGGNETFGITKLAQTLAVPSGFPAHLHALLPDIYTEAKRPSHFNEVTGLPFLATLHPDFEPWGQGPHFDRSVSPDNFGKPDRYTWTTQPTGGWYPEDWAHSGSSMVLAGHALLAGSALSRLLCLSDTEFYKAIKPGWGAWEQARGLGRSLLDVAWAELAVDDPRLRAHVAVLLDKDPRLAAVRQRITDDEDIVTYEINFAGDGRKFDGRTPFWMPWSSPGLLLQGIVAAQVMTGDATLANEELVAMTETLAEHGIWFDGTQWRVADAIVYRGPALPEEAFADRSLVMLGSYEDWIYPGLALVLDRLPAGRAKERASKYCIDILRRFANGPAPKNPFERPIPFLAVPKPATIGPLDRFEN